MLFQNGGY